MRHRWDGRETESNQRRHWPRPDYHQAGCCPPTAVSNQDPAGQYVHSPWPPCAVAGSRVARNLLSTTV